MSKTPAIPAVPVRVPRFGSRADAGVTLIELIIVIAIFTVIGLTSTVWMTKALGQRALDSAADQAVDALREAQFSVMYGRNGARFGVRFLPGQFILFQGAAFDPASADNVAYQLPSDVSITAVTLTGGGADVHFADHRGVPAESGSVVFTSAYGGGRTVTIGSAGMIAAD